MPRYTALLRGINVGRNKRVAMADLRALLAGLGHTEVRTHLVSGNAVFTAPDAEPDDLAAAIERAIEAELGMAVRCLVRGRDDLHAVITANPFPQHVEQGSRLMACFLSARPDPALVAQHDPATLDPGRIVLGERVIYQWCPDGLLAAPDVGLHAQKLLGTTVTVRNWNTVRKIGELLDV